MRRQFPLPARGFAAEIAQAFNLRRKSGGWRGDCPRCGARNCLTVTAAGTNAAYASCRAGCEPGFVLEPEKEPLHG